MEEASETLLRSYRKKVSYRKKGPIDFVSEVDIRSEKRILSLIRKEFPEHRIYSEEAGFCNKDSSESEYVWYIDPLDGTHNYIHGVYPFGVSIALTKGDEVLVGAIKIPLMDELYVGVKGKGATLNKKKLKVSARGRDEAMISWTSRFRVHPEVRLKLLDEFAQRFEMLRAHGCASQNCAWIAAGRMDMMLTFGLPPHDIAAGYVIMQEAGARITDFNGKKTNFRNGEFLITNGKLHTTALKITKKFKKENPTKTR